MTKENDILDITKQTHQNQIQQPDAERLQALRYMDDSFMTVCLADNFEGVGLILRIVLGRDDITIKSVRTQELMKNLQGRSVVLDVHAIDSTDREFDVEIQRANAGAGAKRARYFKQNEKGVTVMSSVLDDIRNEGELKATKDDASRLLKLGKVKVDELSEFFPRLSEGDIKELEAEVMHLT